MKRLVGFLLVVGALWWAVEPDPPLPRADFVLGNGGEPRSLDPALATANIEGRIARALFEGLVIPEGPELTPSPATAESWRVEDDGRRYVFTLRADARWSDGVPVKAQDFVYGFLRLLDPDVGSRSAAYLFDVKGARAFLRAALAGSRPDPSTVGLRATDDRTLTIDLERPSPAFLGMLGLASLAPLRKDVVERPGRRWTHPGNLASNGPFKLVYRSVRDRVRLARNEHYWDAARVGLATFDILALDQPNTLVNLYFHGDIDWLTDVPPALLRPIAAKHPGHLRLGPLYATYFYRVNTRLKPFTNRKVRAALDLALDKEGIVGAFLAGGERPARSLIPPLVGSPPPAPRDLDRARKLMAEGLAEVGLSALPSFELSFNANPLHQAIAELVQAQWSEAFGTTVSIARMEQQAYLAAIERGDYAVARGSWVGDYADPLTFLDVFNSSDPNNQTGFSHARYDEVVLKELRETADPARRAALAAEAAAILDGERPVIPIYHYASTNLLRPGFEGFEENVLDLHFPKFIRKRD
jgi:oligopeptide transport system substrate-binding protein